MEQSISSTIQQNVNFLYKKKLVKHWPSDLVNAELAIKYAWRSDTIFDLLTTIIFKDNLCFHKILDPENIEVKNEVVETTDELQRWDFSHSNLSEIEYFSTLSISRWTYAEFILSALVFCIKNKLHNENLLKNFVYNCARCFAPVFLDKNLLSSSIFSCIVELKLFDFFPVEATSGFTQYLKPFFTPEINIEGRLKAISKFLYIFSYFPVSFIKECLLDCKQQNNLNPIILALYVLNMRSQPLQNEKKFAYEQLENFKKKLVLLKLVNSEFIHKCNLSYFPFALQSKGEKQKEIPFIQYYSSFD